MQHDLRDVLRQAMTDASNLAQHDPERCRQLVRDTDTRCRAEDSGIPLPLLVDYLRSIFIQNQRVLAEAGGGPLTQARRRQVYDRLVDGFAFCQANAWMRDEWHDDWEQHVRPKLVILISDVADMRPEVAAEQMGMLTWSPDAEEIELIGASLDVDDPSAVMLLLNRMSTLVALEGEVDVLAAMEPVAGLWSAFLEGDGHLSGRSGDKWSQVEHCLDVLDVRCREAPASRFFGIAIEKVQAAAGMICGALAVAMGAPTDRAAACDRLIATYGRHPSAILMTVDIYAEYGRIEEARELFQAIDPLRIRADQREDYRLAQRLLNPGGGWRKWLRL